MGTLSVDAGSPLTVPDLTGQLHGLSTSIPATLYAALKAKYWRINDDVWPATFNACFATSTSPPTPIFIFSDWYANTYLGSGYPISMPTVAALNTAVAAFVSQYLSGGADQLPVGTIVDLVNEPDNPASWFPQSPAGQQQFNLFFYTVGLTLKALASPPPICGPSIARYDTDSTWIANAAGPPGLLDYISSQASPFQVDYVSWHEESSALPSTPATAATNVGLGLALISTNGYNGPPISVQGVMVNEYGSQVSDQWRNPAAMLGYVVRMETAGAAIAARTCWPNSRKPNVNACFDGNSMSLLLSESGSNSPMGTYQVYKRLGESKNRRLAVTPPDATIDAFAYLEGDKIVVVIGPWDGPLFVPVSTIALSITGLSGSFPTSVKWGTTVLDQYKPAGRTPPITIQGAATVSSGAVSVNLPKLNYGQTMVVELGILAPRKFIDLRRKRRVLSNAIR